MGRCNKIIELTGLPLAFGAGILAAFNPCGAAVLPTYIVFLLGESKKANSSKIKLIQHGLTAGMAMALGFLSVFILTGMLLTVIGHTVSFIIPWLNAAAGILLIIYSIIRIAVPADHKGGNIYLNTSLSRLAPKPGEKKGIHAFYIYGLGYAVISMGCTLPIFLVAVFTSFTAGGLLSGINSFILYSLGMGIVVSIISTTSLLAGEITRKWLSKISIYFDTLISILLLLTGIYLTYYWLFGPGGLL